MLSSSAPGAPQLHSHPFSQGACLLLSHEQHPTCQQHSDQLRKLAQPDGYYPECALTPQNLFIITMEGEDAPDSIANDSTTQGSAGSSSSRPPCSFDSSGSYHSANIAQGSAGSGSTDF